MSNEKDEQILPEVLDYRVSFPLGSMTHGEQTKFWMVEGRIRMKAEFDTGFSFESFYTSDNGHLQQEKGATVREWNLDWSLKGMTANEILEELRYYNMSFDVEITVRD